MIVAHKTKLIDKSIRQRKLKVLKNVRIGGKRFESRDHAGIKARI